MPTVDHLGIALAVAGVVLVFWWLRGTVEEYLPDERQIDWQFDTFEWFLRHLRPNPTFDDGSLIEPTPEDFPVDTVGHERAKQLFEYVRAYAGMSQWPCRLEPRGPDPGQQEIHELVPAIPEDDAAGTFEVREDDVTISYNARLVERPMELVAVFAHELAHYLMASVEDLPPGGVQALEPSTDLCAIYMGFGLFQTNAAFQFERKDDAFVMQSEARFTGYLNEGELAYGLAIFAALHELDPDGVAHHLDGNPRAYFRDAYSDVTGERSERVKKLRDLL